MGKYDDMINMSRPLSTHPSMPVADRAKIFQPFAALKGHEDLIREQQKINEAYWENRIEKEMLYLQNDDEQVQ